MDSPSSQPAVAPLATIPEEENSAKAAATLPLLVEDVVRRQREHRHSVALPTGANHRRGRDRMTSWIPDCFNCGSPTTPRSPRRTVKEDHVDAVNSMPLGARQNDTLVSSYLNPQYMDEHDAKRFDVNLYAAKKSAANGLMDLALLMANASQLKHVLVSGEFRLRDVDERLQDVDERRPQHVYGGPQDLYVCPQDVHDRPQHEHDRVDGEHRFYIIMLTLIIASISLQILIGIALLVLSRWRIAEVMDSDELETSTRRANVINNVVVASILLLTVLNVFISAFGLDEAKPKK